MDTIVSSAKGMAGRLNAGEAGGGSISLEFVIISAFVIGLGAALMSTQGIFRDAIADIGTYISDLFASITTGRN